MSVAVDLAPYIVAGVVPLGVAWLTFRYAVRQDARRWWRDQRAAVYVDTLVEGYAELQYLNQEVAERRLKKPLPTRPDLRMPPMERARLGARGTAFSSADVNRWFNEIQRESFLLLAAGSDADLEGFRIRAEIAHEELQKQIRKEFDAERS